MNRRSFLALPLAITAGITRADVEYPHVMPGEPLRFPRDYGSHPDFRTEWWYVTGWIRNAAGDPFGVQVTFFRNRPGIAESNRSAFAPRQLVFAHAAIADGRRAVYRHDQRVARAGLGLAGADERSMHAWIDEWSLVRSEKSYMAHIVAREFELDLAFTPTQPVLMQGVDGYSRKGPLPEQASYYYSEPQLAVSGTVQLANERHVVTGSAWLDHEWSSEVMAPEAAGWDWVGLNLADGGALMVFRMRNTSGGSLWAGGTLRGSNGRVRSFAPDEVRFAPSRSWRSPRTRVEYPVGMTLEAGGDRYDLEPMFDDQELDSRASTGTIYWEGAVRALRGGTEVGRGYLELTGYGTPVRI